MLIDLIKKQALTKVVAKKALKCGVLVISFLFSLVVYSAVSANSLNKVIRVIDGDTLVLLNEQKVRLLGVNAPELGYNGVAHDAGAVTAKRFLKTLVLNKYVVIEKDMEHKDHYGRTLAHVFLKSGQHINRELLHQGKALLNIHPPNLKYSQRLMEAQSQAESARRGVWLEKDYQLKLAAYIPNERTKKWGRFSSKVEQVNVLKKGTKLWLNKEVYIWIGAKNRRYFSPAAKYQGQIIEIRGWPRKWGKFWSINAIHPSQLLIKIQ